MGGLLGARTSLVKAKFEGLDGDERDLYFNQAKEKKEATPATESDFPTPRYAFFMTTLTRR